MDHIEYADSRRQAPPRGRFGCVIRLVYKARSKFLRDRSGKKGVQAPERAAGSPDLGNMAATNNLPRYVSKVFVDVKRGDNPRWVSRGVKMRRQRAEVPGDTSEPL